MTATGSDKGTTFTRQKNLLVAIDPNDLQLNGTYADQPSTTKSMDFMIIWISGSHPFECGWQKPDFKTANFAIEMSKLSVLEA